MDKCESCEHRFDCFTTPTSKRPLKVKLNTNVPGACSACKYGNFKLKNATWGSYNRQLTESVGICKKDPMIIHKSTTCNNFTPKKERGEIAKKAVIAESIKKRYGTKLPKYCIIE